MRAILALMLALLTTAPTVAKEGGGRPLLPGIIGSDNRVMLDSIKAPWSALGRVNRARGGFCTGTVIAPDRVLTARHCLTARPGNRYLPLSELHFVAGYRRGEFLAHGKVRSIHAPPLSDQRATSGLGGAGTGKFPLGPTVALARTRQQCGDDCRLQPEPPSHAQPIAGLCAIHPRGCPAPSPASLRHHARHLRRTRPTNRARRPDGRGGCQRRDDHTRWLAGGAFGECRGHGRS